MRRALLVVMVAALTCVAGLHAQIAPVIADPPIAVQFAAEAFAELPDGGFVRLAAGTQIAACGPAPVRYEVDSRAVVIPQPCVTVFADGFE